MSRSADQNHSGQLPDKYPIISDQISRPALETVLLELEQVLEAGTPGDIVEFGCYIGTTSLFIRRLLDSYGSEKQFYVYDSFEGLPPKGEYDASVVGDAFKGGELSVSKKQFLAQFQRAGLKPPKVVKGWFGELTPSQVPERISFAFLDGDFYQSILDSLILVWPRMVEGGVICLDDYNREALPGVSKAVQDFFRGKPVKPPFEPKITVAHNIGIIRV